MAAPRTQMPPPFAPPLLTLRRATWALGVVYFFGWWGMQWPPARPYFLAATPLSLLLTAALLYALHPGGRRRPLALFGAITYLTGFLVEWVGIHTGWIFGTYHYGSTLGLQLDGVPLVIGVNWLILIYCTGTVLTGVRVGGWGRAALGATLMTALDVLIEPTAVAFDYWSWEGRAVPLQNYLGWWLTSLLLLRTFGALPFAKGNPLAARVLALQAAFFLAHTLLLWWR